MSKNIQINQAECKHVVALIAHLRQVMLTPLNSKGKLTRPIEIDHAQLLLGSASLRTLLFDDTPSPILLDFINQHDIELEIESLETDISMLLLAQVKPTLEPHASDFLFELHTSEETKNQFELDTPSEVFLDIPNYPKFEKLRKKPELWLPSQTDTEKMNSGFGITNNGPSQIFLLTRKIVPLKDWGNLRVGFLKNIPIRRRNIITYVANKLGGVHYDSSRLPTNSEDASEFKLLAQAYDWDKQSVMHAGLVAVALACIELSRTPLLFELLIELEQFHRNRQDRLNQGILL